MGEGGVEGENCFKEVPPHPDPRPTVGRGEQKDNPLPRWGEGNIGRREEEGAFSLKTLYNQGFPAFILVRKLSDLTIDKTLTRSLAKK